MQDLVLKMSSTAGLTSVMQLSNIFWQEGSVETFGGAALASLVIGDAMAREARMSEERATGRVLKSIAALAG